MSGLVTESNDVSPDENHIWEYIKENPKLIGVPITEDKSLNLLGALLQIREAVGEEEWTESIIMLDMLATALVSAVEGTGDKIVEELIVAEAMENFDQQVKGIIDESN